MAQQIVYLDTLTSVEVNTLCQLATHAWQKAQGRTRRVWFKWEQRYYISVLEASGMLISTEQGTPVCRQYKGGKTP